MQLQKNKCKLNDDMMDLVIFTFVVIVLLLFILPIGIIVKRLSIRALSVWIKNEFLV